ncbi:flagellar assembly protein FliH [Hahella sp. HN01]|uniref:flagellar assembly protein FliH n=1 Tax=Hahella sp. HN01 TaxID=2847262 RepID=UPI001C1EDCAD|nr:flagellar assembly protein FliH [Hahella sp. HN01]MBU6949880.1 flagellar assembly protein FliH [Hahella sp. HN01]
MKDQPETIPKEKLTAYERWELPVMGEQQETPKIKPPTAAELENIRQSAYQEGLEQGKEEGFQKGFEQGHAEGKRKGEQQGLEQGRKTGESEAVKSKSAAIDQALSHFEELATELEAPIRKHQDEVEEALLNLVLAISRAVVFRELKVDRSQILRVLQEALAALPNTEELVTIYLHPQDLAFAKEHLPPERGTRYQADPALMEGGCRVETRHTLLDFTVEKRFQTTVQQMLSRHSDDASLQETKDFTDQMGEMSDLHRDLLEKNAEAPPPVPEAHTEPSKTEEIEADKLHQAPSEAQETPEGDDESG